MQTFLIACLLACAAVAAAAPDTWESLTIRTPAGEHRLRSTLIGAGIGVAVSLVADQTVGTYLRNESNPDAARPLIWTVPIATGAAVGVAFPSHPTIYRK